MRLSIVTLTFNQLEEATRPFLESLYAETRAEDFELVVVDNGSTDGTVPYLQSICRDRGNMTLHMNDRNEGYSRGNNLGLNRISTETPYIGLFNNDVLFTPGWLMRMIEAFESEPRLGLASPRINDSRSMTRTNFRSRYRRMLARYKDPVTFNVTPYFCCVMMRRRVLEKVGLLDEAYSPAFFEDDDYSMRSLYAGFLNGYVNTAFVYHNHCTTSGRMSDRRELLDRNRRIFYDKHYLGRVLYEQALDLRKPWRALWRRVVRGSM